MTVLVEGELEFSFPDPLAAEIFDIRGRSFPQGIRPVDFLVGDDQMLFLVEVKDPSGSRVPQTERARYVRSMQTRELAHEELVPKARGTYSYLHLMRRDDRPMGLVVVIATELLSIQPVLLMNLRDRLRRRLAREADDPWARQYMGECFVVTPADLGKVIPGATAQRV